jgi:N-acetylmuramoyl-L-alanine amidase
MRRITSDQWPMMAAIFALLVAGGALLFYVLVQKPPVSDGRPVPPAGPPPSMTLSALAPEPQWAQLARFANTLSAEDFQVAMDRVYGDGTEDWRTLLMLEENGALASHVKIVPWSADAGAPPILLGLQRTHPTPRFWREAAELPPSSDRDASPLEGVKVAVDPGHLGGEWARMEQRWYQPPDESTAVMEGEMTLMTARLLKRSLEAMGAEVFLLRESSEPVTAMRPDDFAGQTASADQAQLFFYRKAEIRARADRVNQTIRPDLVICLHFNAEPWGDPGKVTFVETNHLHLIVNGHYGMDELKLDDVRYEMLERLFQRCEREELRLADAVARSLAAATELPPYDYGAGHMAGNAHRPLPENPYVWARNLMANRLYQCPVVFTEPYVMNNREVYDRVAAGDYEGERLVAGKIRRSLYREYAEGVAAGLKAHFLSHRPAPPPKGVEK